MSRIKHACTIIRQRYRAKTAQGMVEFALALPILLLLVFGIIEFGRLLQAWLALENGARFGVRYAVTGSFNPTYCDQADTALNLQYDDMLDGNPDCLVPDRYPSGANAGQSVPHADEESNRLQDWARLPSVRDAAISGATGIAWNNSTTVSGDYLNFLTHAFSDKQTCTSGGNTVPCPDYRGDPSAKGYFTISVCSNRANPIDDYNPFNDDGGSFLFDPNAFYFPASPMPTDPTKLDLLCFPTYCQEVNQSNSVVRYIDDAGGPGDRVRPTLTYRHTLITPFVSTWWPTLRLTSEREGIVEKFRTSRVTGLSGAVAQAATWTYTPLPNTLTPTPTTTLTPTITNTVTTTPTRTLTFTPTLTATPYCGAITFGAPGDANLDLDDFGTGVYVYMANTSNLPATLTGANVQWLNPWNSVAPDVRNQDIATGFGWYSGSLNTFWTMPTSGGQAQFTMTAPGSWDRTFGTTYNMTAGSSGQLVVVLKNALEQASFASPKAPTDTWNYYHGADFQITVRYTIGGISCSQTVTGYDGPKMSPVVTTGNGVVGIDAVATGYKASTGTFAADGISLVTFTVLDLGGNMVHYQRDGGNPWCLFGFSGGVCKTRRVYVDYWTNNGTNTSIIQPGTCTVHIIARDKNSGNYATHTSLILVIPVGNTPTVTATSTNTNTPKPSKTPTQTRTPLPTPTKSLIPSATTIPSATPIPSVTRTPTKTNTRPPTSTPTECQTPIEMGGCR